MQTLPLTETELAAWLRLSTAAGLKPAAVRTLLELFGLPDAIFGQSFAALASATSVATARAVLNEPGPDFYVRVEALCLWCATPGNALLTLADPAYPPALLNMADPPPLLYAKGRIELLQRKSVAVIGSRNATAQGISDAFWFSGEFSRAGLAVVSGLALGIDGAAHRGALAGPGGTVAVIGTGADIVYPASHLALSSEIASTGVILSEWPLGTPPRAAHFPQRNRLIAGLASGVLLIEAAIRSGSLITARLANEMGRDVFALPGSIHAPLSRGCHQLIKQGAKLVETPQDVMEEWGLATSGQAAATATTAAATATAIKEVASRGKTVRTARARSQAGLHAGVQPLSAAENLASLPPDALQLLDALGHAPAPLETLVARTGLSGPTLQSTLLLLELAGHLTLMPGGRYARTHTHR
ncbi:DNA-processing protein DprA [Paraburkholderia bonniea]|uniref:DNA-processing protein DprA n=1 Tax=Paraburkholderia bonniea TaxID=2152891 RepID=UPI00129115E3|nr:DNA-processing protein DprA [Paraburkholderia bonniea]WJF91469.1 DNA-processing protein DprA [Paraburkholderia bonniea]WJF94788.1 DNA-processing protein DprA [Paraburkholderia bonniea]